MPGVGVRCRMRIGIVYDLIRWEERALAEAAERLGHEVRLIQVTRDPLWLGYGNGLGDLDFVFQRCVSYYRAMASAMILEEEGVPVVNSYQVIAGTEDKLYTTLKLAKAGLPVPKTAVALSKEASLKAAEKLGYPLVVKPIYGSWGRMIARAMNEENLLEILEFREHMQSPHFKVHYLQEYVEKPGRDIRACYVWGEVPAAIYRVSERWKTNTALGAEAVAANLPDEIKELVRRAGDLVGGGVLGVDLVEKNGEPLILEINGIPQFKNVVRATGYDLAGKIIESTVSMFKR